MSTELDTPNAAGSGVGLPSPTPEGTSPEAPYRTFRTEGDYTKSVDAAVHRRLKSLGMDSLDGLKAALEEREQMITANKARERSEMDALQRIEAEKAEIERMLGERSEQFQAAHRELLSLQAAQTVQTESGKAIVDMNYANYLVRDSKTAEEAAEVLRLAAESNPMALFGQAGVNPAATTTAPATKAARYPPGRPAEPFDALTATPEQRKKRLAEIMSRRN